MGAANDGATLDLSVALQSPKLATPYNEGVDKLTKGLSFKVGSLPEASFLRWVALLRVRKLCLELLMQVRAQCPLFQRINDRRMGRDNEALAIRFVLFDRAFIKRQACRSQGHRRITRQECCLG